MKVDSLFISLAVDGTDSIKQAETAVKSLYSEMASGAKSLAVAGVAAAATIAALGAGFKAMATQVIGDVSAMQKFNTETGLSIDKLTQWQRAAKQSDLSANIDNITSSVVGLQNKLTQLEMGKLSPDQANGFLRLGINTQGKDAFKVLDELREKMQFLTNPQAVNLLSDLGLGSEFLGVLRMTKTEFDAISNSNLLSAKQRNDVLALGRAFESIKFQMQDVKDQMIAGASPEFLRMLNDFSEWMSDHKDEIMQFFNSLVGVFQSLIGFAGEMGAAISSALKPVIALWDNLPDGLKAWLATAGTAAFVPGGKAIAAAGAVEDTVYGLQSVTKAENGEAVDESFLGIAAMFSNAMEAFASLKDNDDVFIPESGRQYLEAKNQSTINQNITINTNDAVAAGKEVAKQTKVTLNDIEVANTVRGNSAF